jgi:serine/threonine-protein kinase
MAGEYRLGRKLGEGGFGAVYEAQHPVLKRRAAVKVLHRVAERDSEAVQRFITEAQAVNQIRSPHIVDIFSFGRLEDGRHFYVMDLLEGEALDSYLSRMSRVDVATTVRLLRPIAEALDVAHAAGIVHRDLKPQNIFLAWDAAGLVVPKLLDFGMAKLLGDVTVNTVSGTPLGTPLYMSPEQALGHKVDRRSDVYALGVLCHELLTGQLPITGETTIAVLMAHIADAPPRASGICPDLPPELDGALLSMLAKDPGARPASAGEALAALASAAASAGVDIPAGLPILPRPAPRSTSSAAGEFSSTFAAESPVEQPSTELSRAARSSNLAQGEGRGSRWRWLSLALVLVGGTLYFTLGARKVPDTEQPAVPAQRGEAERSPGPAAMPATSGTPSAELPRSAADPTSDAAQELAGPSESSLAADAAVRSAKRKRQGASMPRKNAIPSDLENPF